MAVYFMCAYIQKGGTLSRVLLTLGKFGDFSF